MTQGHIHAEAMRLYAEDAAKTPEPWNLWQAGETDDGPWVDMDCHPAWYTGVKYRRKPVTKKMIRIGDRWVPEPMREAPPNGSKFYAVSPHSNSPLSYSWSNCNFDLRLLKIGSCHITREAAQQHLDAIIALNNQEAQDVECE